MRNKKGKIFFWVIFVIYLSVLLKVIIFKYPIPMIIEVLKSFSVSSLAFRMTHSNFIPLKSIFEYLFETHNARISAENLLGNIALFIPLGFMLPVMMCSMNKLKSSLLSAFALSLMLEVVQLLTGLGEFDVDDILLNSLGGILGHLFYRISKDIVKV